MVYGKILISIVLMIASAYWIIRGPSIPSFLSNYFGIVIPAGTALFDFLTVVNGIVPPLIFLIGLFFAWIEIDELRIERELAKEEKKIKKKK